MFKYITFNILCYATFVNARECDDCVKYSSCPAAVDQAVRVKNAETFRNAFCGFDSRVPKICCLDFENPETSQENLPTTTDDVNENLRIRAGQNERSTKTPATTGQCEDCMVYSLCPRALESARNRTNQLVFISSHCGMDYSQSKPTPKVCCSKFDAPIEPPRSQTSNDLLPDTCGDIDGRRIIGGSIAGLYEYPWMALISHKISFGVDFKCGGTIINSRYILTAAHCVRNKELAGVRIGEHDIRYATDCQGSGKNYICESHLQDIGVEENIVHENYTTYPNIINDIALLRLQDPIDFSFQNAAPICLPRTIEMMSISLDGRNATVAGWGLTEHNRYSSVLQKVEIPIIGRNECLNIFTGHSYVGKPTKYLDVNQLCAGKENKDSCNGDSGGPLMVETRYQGAYRIVQYGIVSHGPSVCGSKAPGIYTDVSKYIEWIIKNIRE